MKRCLIIGLMLCGMALAQGTVRIGWAGSPDTLNPGTAVLSEAFTLFDLVYDSLFNLELDGSIQPELVDTYEVSEDGTVWTFKLHEGAMFHDGEPLTAADVAFSLDYYKANEDFPFANGYTSYFDSIEAADDSTVLVTLSEAIPNMLSQLLYLYILPEHIWSSYPAGSAATEFENLEMIGSGPFKMTEYKQGEYVRLSANKDHYAKAPNIDEIVFQTFGSQDVLVQALRTGQVDMITEMPNTAVVSLRNDPNIELVIGAPLSPSVRDIIFNVTNSDTCPADDGICSGHPALLDLNVRQALAHATDKLQIIDVALLGLGTPGTGLIMDGMGEWFNSSLEDYVYDPEAANKLLDDAGYLDSNGDGVREMPDGSRDLSFRFYWPNDVIEAPRVAELLSQMWGDIGVKLELQALDPDALTSVCCPSFDFDIIMWGWSSDPDPGFMLSVLTSDEIPTGTSETGYSNPEYDELYAAQATELDPAKRQEIVWQMQAIMLRDLPYIIPYYQQQVQAFRTDRFSGWITDATKVALEDPSSLTQIEAIQ
ncbi:MAG: ABC transporter substrate-binding protein [Trueperaceae bacterium]|nr:ABC transporter substrate-binding protein [Trueperaceae bacterium]